MVTFWDTSAVVPLLVEEPDSDRRREQLASCEFHCVAWWGTRTECITALCRCERENRLDAEAFYLAQQKCRILLNGFGKVRPSDPLQEQAERMLRTYPLRAADSFQLAGALMACEGRPSSHGAVFVCGDVRLTHAARKEGFEVLV
jgi:predicted nucleic acid-binding protein